MLTGISPRNVPKRCPGEVNHYLDSVNRVLKKISSQTPPFKFINKAMQKDDDQEEEGK